MKKEMLLILKKASGSLDWCKMWKTAFLKCEANRESTTAQITDNFNQEGNTSQNTVHNLLLNMVPS